MTAGEAALNYLKRGILGVPVPHRSKNPGFRGWQDLRLNTPELVQSRFNCVPQNYGVLLGEPSGGLVDVDLDFCEGRIPADAYFGNTATFGRPGKPRSHRLFLANPLPETRQFRFANEMVVEVRSTGAQTIAPPSMHPSGEQIEWQGSTDEIAHIDREMLLKNAGIVAAGSLLARHWPKKPGVRDELAMALAGGLLRAGWSPAEAERFILAVCQAAGDEQALERSLKARHTDAKIESEKPTTGWRRLGEHIDKDVVAKVREWLGATDQVEPGSLGLTDLGNARRLVDQQGADLRYVHLWDKWIFWAGTHWQNDETGEVSRRAKETVRLIYQEASAAPDKEDRKAIASYATRSESEGKIRAMISLAQSESEIAITPRLLDQDAMLLTCLTGTIDLKTGTLRPHDRSDFITRVIPVEYDPDALCPLWNKTLEEIFPAKPELVDFLQRAVGYSLTGITREQEVFILWGAGANGKTTIIETLRDLLADYARQIPAGSLMIRKLDSGQSNDIARLKGARLVTASECEEGQRLAESRIKALTGGDKVVARYLHKEFFEFKPEFKLWLLTNHKPRIRGIDIAIWRRIRLIPFTVSFPPEKQDRELSRKLREELPGILAWAVRGCLEWQRNGLGEVDEVRKATEEYRSEMDIVALFIQDRCVQSPTVEIAATSLYQAFLRWAEENSERKMSQRSFGLRLTEKGFHKDPTRYGTRYIGLALSETEP